MALPYPTMLHPPMLYKMYMCSSPSTNEQTKIKNRLVPRLQVPPVDEVSSALPVLPRLRLHGAPPRRLPVHLALQPREVLLRRGGGHLDKHL